MKQKFTVVAGTPHKVEKGSNEERQIAYWFYKNYSHTLTETESKEVISKAGNNNLHEEGSLFYTIRK